jgi:glycosyltransferase involved in cell wall biosynthesis
VRVAYFQRRRRPGANFSVEAIFSDLRARLGSRVDSTVVLCPFTSDGILRRVLNTIVAPFSQGDLNHVTGDVNYVGILLSPRKTVQTILDLQHLSRTTGLRHLLLKWLWVDLPIRRCAHVTVISEATKAELLRHTRVPARKVSVIPVAISAAFARTDKEFSNSCPVILQVGTAANKNLPRLVEAMSGLAFKLDIIGRREPETEDLLERSGVRYTWVTDLTDDDVVRHYQAADVVALVSTYEGFGMPILEAQAVGRVVVTSNVLSMPEVAGGAAHLVDPYNVKSIRDGLLRVSLDAEYRRQLVERGFSNVKRFDAHLIANQYLEVYSLVMNARSGRAR